MACKNLETIGTALGIGVSFDRRRATSRAEDNAVDVAFAAGDEWARQQKCPEPCVRGGSGVLPPLPGFPQLPKLLVARFQIPVIGLWVVVMKATWKAFVECKDPDEQ